MVVFWNHVVVIRTAHDFDLHLYFGAARPPDLPFHVHERQFLNLVRVTRDPCRLMELMTQEVPDGVDFD
jgi:hypothetical protein